MTPRRVGAGLAILAAIAVMFGTFSMRWLKMPRGNGGVGLTGVEVCGHGYQRERAQNLAGRDSNGGGDGDCMRLDWDEMTRGGRVDRELEILETGALVALIGSVLAAALLVVVGVLGLATQKSLSLVTIFSILGSILALLGAIATVMLLRKRFHAEHMALGYSFYVYIVGCVVGAIGSIVSRAGRGYATPRA
jgi:hypothetical protein